MSHDVTCVIPRWGRTFVRIMERLARVADEGDSIRRVIGLVRDGRSATSPDPAEAAATLRNADCPHLIVAPDRKRADRRYRIGFLGMDVRIGDIRLRIEGDEPHNGSSLIRLDEADFTIVGLDELLAMCQHLLRDPSRVTKWGLFNYNAVTDSDLRIAGSADLTSYHESAGAEIADFVGFFLISGPTLQRRDISFTWLAQHRMPVFVKGRYEELICRLFPGINTTAVENVEDAVLTEGQGVGVEIVQTGSTVARKGLRVWGSPLFISESVYVAGYHRYLRNERLRELFGILAPRGYFDRKRIEHYVAWFKALEMNLGSAWMHRPEPDSLFCSVEEMRRGLRPYRLKTRRWVPSDRYKVDEAEALVSRSLHSIRELYQGA